MYEKFGEFNTFEEINAAARGFRDEGDVESLLAFAEENGIEKDDAMDYAAGDLQDLTTVYTAAVGKIAAEKRELAQKGAMERMALNVIANELLGMVGSSNEMAAAVCTKGKRISNVYEAMKKIARKHAKGGTGCSCGTDRQLRDIIRTYYMGTEKELEQRLDALYREVGG